MQHVRSRLANGEEVLAIATFAPPGALESGQSRPVQAVMTRHRLLVFRAGWLTNRNLGELLWQTPVDEISAVSTVRRHPFQGLGVPFLDVLIACTDATTITFVSSGLKIRRAKQFALVVQAVIAERCQRLSLIHI